MDMIETRYGAGQSVWVKVQNRTGGVFGTEEIYADEWECVYSKRLQLRGRRVSVLDQEFIDSTLPGPGLPLPSEVTVAPNGVTDHNGSKDHDNTPPDPLVIRKESAQ